MLKRNAGLLIVALLIAMPVHADIGLGSDLIPNMIGIGAGSTTRYSGANESVTMAAPGFRYQFKDSQRYMDWYGPLGSANLSNSSEWQFGPAINIRGGRKDADDDAVARLEEIDITVEGGLLASYTWNGTGSVPYRLRVGAIVLTDLGDRYSGTNTSLFAGLWVPVSQTVLIGGGLSASIVSADFNRTYYGVTTADSAASGLPTYRPDGGLRQWSAWQAVIVRLSPEWALGAGVFYQRLVNDAADSPIVRDHGDRSQWTFGLGVAYTWK